MNKASEITQFSLIALIKLLLLLSDTLCCRLFLPRVSLTKHEHFFLLQNMGLEINSEKFQHDVRMSCKRPFVEHIWRYKNCKRCFKSSSTYLKDNCKILSLHVKRRHLPCICTASHCIVKIRAQIADPDLLL